MSALFFYVATLLAFLTLLYVNKYVRQRFLKRGIHFLLFVTGSFIILETTAAFSLYIFTDVWIYKEADNENFRLFEPHPYLVGMPKKSIREKLGTHLYSHNSAGFRNEEFQPKNKRIRIAAVGGSTTYGVGVNDNETWPHYLDSLGGNEYEVLNFGVPGHSSIEDLILCSVLLPTYEPDIVILHTGLNDIRNGNMQLSATDYTEFHAPTLFGSLGFCYRNAHPKFAVLRIMIILLEKAGLYPVCDFHSMIAPAYQPNQEEYLKLFNDHLLSIKGIAQVHSWKLIFAPQVLHPDPIKEGKLRWWIPNLTDAEIIQAIDKTNQILKQQATDSVALCVNELLEHNFDSTLYADASHLNQRGNFIFATILDQFIRKHERFLFP